MCLSLVSQNITQTYSPIDNYLGNFEKKSDMDLQTSKLQLVKMIVNINSQKTINKLLNVLKSEQDDFWFGLSEIEKQEIKLGIKQLENGQRISLNDFLEKIQ